jgi:hypothetical protein
LKHCTLTSKVKLSDFIGLSIDVSCSRDVAMRQLLAAAEDHLIKRTYQVPWGDLPDVSPTGVATEKI